MRRLIMDIPPLRELFVGGQRPYVRRIPEKTASFFRYRCRHGCGGEEVGKTEYDERLPKKMRLEAERGLA